MKKKSKTSLTSERKLYFEGHLKMCVVSDLHSEPISFNCTIL